MCADFLSHDSTPEQRLMAGINRLSKLNGNLEIKFINSDSTSSDKVCLVFITLPLSKNIESRIRHKVKNNNLAPLSTGRLSVETGEHLILLTGIIRVKSINKLGNVVYGFIDRLIKIISNTKSNYLN